VALVATTLVVLLVSWVAAVSLATLSLSMEREMKLSPSARLVAFEEPTPEEIARELAEKQPPPRPAWAIEPGVGAFPVEVLTVRQGERLRMLIRRPGGGAQWVNLAGVLPYGGERIARASGGRYKSLARWLEEELRGKTLRAKYGGRCKGGPCIYLFDHLGLINLRLYALGLAAIEPAELDRPYQRAYLKLSPHPVLTEASGSKKKLAGDGGQSHPTSSPSMVKTTARASPRPPRGQSVRPTMKRPAREGTGEVPPVVMLSPEGAEVFGVRVYFDLSDIPPAERRRLERELGGIVEALLSRLQR